MEKTVGGIGILNSDLFSDQFFSQCTCRLHACPVWYERFMQSLYLYYTHGGFRNRQRCHNLTFEHESAGSWAGPLWKGCTMYQYLRHPHFFQQRFQVQRFNIRWHYCPTLPMAIPFNTTYYTYSIVSEQMYYLMALSRQTISIHQNYWYSTCK